MRIHQTVVAALLLACGCAPAAAAQTAVLRPGSVEVSTQAITDRVDEFEVQAGGDGWVPVGRMTLRTRLATVGGVEAVVRTERIWMDDELVQLDSFTLHRKTLAPLAMHSSSTETGVELAFTPGSVRQVDDGDWGADTSHVPLPEPVFAAGTTDLLLGSLPLAPGYHAELAVFDAEDGIDTIAIEVEAVEEVPLPEGGSVSAWRVGVTEGFLVSTYWMDRESHTLVQFESSDGSLRIVRSRGGRSRARPTR
ncbi:MAG TPA: hypothetical protein VFT45_01305 [Longimicrobium sp.]|nr:hypothetical protein [Longimicrobium sp.]